MKLKKNIVVNAIGAKNIHWMIKDALHGIVSGGWLVKDGDYWYGFDGDGVQIPLRYNQRKKSDLIEAISEYAENSKNGVVDEEKRKEEEANKAYNFAEFKLMEFKSSSNVEYKENDIIDIEVHVWNKPYSLGCHFEVMYKYPNELVKSKGFVEKVINVEPEELDDYIENFYDGDVAVKLKPELKGMGGSGDIHGFDVIYLVAVIAKGRKPLLINPEGFDYARYIALVV